MSSRAQEGIFFWFASTLAPENERVDVQKNARGLCVYLFGLGINQKQERNKFGHSREKSVIFGSKNERAGGPEPKTRFPQQRVGVHRN